MRVFSWMTWCWGLGFAAACYVLFFLSSPTNPRGDSRIALWLVPAIAVCAAATTIWTNRGSLAESGWPMRVIRGFGAVLGTWLALLLCLIPVLLIPVYADYTPRAKFAEVLLGASTLRNEITERAQRQRDLAGAGDGLRIEPGGKISGGMVSTNGAVVVYSEVLGAIAVLVPQQKSGELVGWDCMGMPRKIAPITCRGGKLFPEHTSLDRQIDGSETAHAAALRELATPLQAEVATAVQAGKPLGTSVRERPLPASDPLDFGYISANGGIALYSDRHGVYVQLTPSLQGGRVVWDCIAYPASAAPKDCRSPAAPTGAR